jgi:hypothetical protein
MNNTYMDDTCMGGTGVRRVSAGRSRGTTVASLASLVVGR